MSAYAAGIGDADIAAEVTALTRSLILSNAAASQLAQANGMFAARARALLAATQA